MPDWYDPNLFANQGAGSAQQGGISGTGGYGQVNSLADFGKAAFNAAGTMLPGLGPILGMINLGVAAKTGQNPSTINTIKTLYGSAKDLLGFGGGAGALSSGNVMGGVAPGFGLGDLGGLAPGALNSIGDITNGGNSMSGETEKPDGPKGRETYAVGGGVRGQHGRGALALMMSHHPHPAMGALGRAMLTHHALRGGGA